MTNIIKQDLVNVTEMIINNENKQVVNARDLWTFLESKRDFSTYIKDRLEGFIENVDYISVHKIVEREIGATTIKEYFLTLDTAKHISMIERNDKGKQIRNYFIQIEKDFHNKLLQPQIPDFNINNINLDDIDNLNNIVAVGFQAALKLAEKERTEKEKALQQVKVLKVDLIEKENKLVETNNTVVEQQNIITEVVEKLDETENILSYYKQMLDTDETITINQMLRILHISTVKGHEILKMKGILLSTGGGRASDVYVRKGYFKNIPVQYRKPDGSMKLTDNSHITALGLLYFFEKRDKIFPTEIHTNNFHISNEVMNEIQSILYKVRKETKQECLIPSVKNNIISFVR